MAGWFHWDWPTAHHLHADEPKEPKSALWLADSCILGRTGYHTLVTSLSSLLYNKQLSNLILYSTDEGLRLIWGKLNSGKYRKIKLESNTNLFYLAYAAQIK